MTGYWELKPSEQLDPYQCLSIDEDDILDIVNLRLDPDREFSDSDREHIFKMVREGYVSGQYDSGVDY